MTNVAYLLVQTEQLRFVPICYHDPIAIIRDGTGHEILLPGEEPPENDRQ